MTVMGHADFERASPNYHLLYMLASNPTARSRQQARRRSCHLLTPFVFPSCTGVRSVFFSHHFFDSSSNCVFFRLFIPYFVFFRPFTTELQYRPPTSVTYRTRYFITLNSPRRTARTCSCPIYSTPFDVSYVPYEIIQLNSQSKKAHQ